MTISRLFLLSLLALGLTAKGSDDKAKVQIQITVRSPVLKYVNFNHPPKTDYGMVQSDIIQLNENGITLIKRELPASPGIVFIAGIPVLISGVEQVSMSMYPLKDKGTVPSHLGHAVTFKGAASGKQSLPYQMDSLYMISPDRLSTMTQTELDGHFKALDQQIWTLMSKAKVVRVADRELLQGYSRLLQAQLKWDFLNAQKDKNNLPPAFGDWYRKGLDLSEVALKKIFNTTMVNVYLMVWEEGQKLQDPQWSDLKKMNLILAAKNNLLNKMVVYPWYKIQIRFKGMTRELQGFYPAMKASFNDPEDVTFWTAHYQTHENMMEGKPAPDFALTDAKGKLVRLSDFKGKMVLIDVWGTWCGPCKQEMPYFHQLVEDFTDSTGIVFMTIAMEAEGDEAWDQYLIDHKMDKTVNLKYLSKQGGEDYAFFREKYGMDSFPRYIAIDRKGNFISPRVGFPSNPDFKAKVVKWHQEKR
jgi:thiol-disulfide isomerase/thioredoxin